MRRSKIEIYLHIVWATYRRGHLLTPVIELQVHKVIWSEAEKLGCHVLALNGMEDHVHVVLRNASRCSLADLVKQMKGVSSNFVNDQFSGEGAFRWQEG